MSASSSFSSLAPSSDPVIVLALTPQVRELFLPGIALAQWGANCHWLDVSKVAPPDWPEALRESAAEILITGWQTPALPRDYLQSERLPLRYVCHLGGSVRGLVPRELLERGVLVTNWGETISYTIAEHAVLLILGALRNVSAWRSYLEASPAERGFAKVKMATRSLRGKRVRLHGFGSIVRQLVPMLQSFQVDLAAYSAGVPVPWIESHGVAARTSLADLAADAEVFVECEALTPESRQSVDETVLSRLPSQAVFINVGRGAVVDEAALIRLAREKEWRVGVDVSQAEPVGPGHPLLTLEEGLISPHIAGPTMDAMPLCGDHALANVARFRRGESVESQVTLAIYDRST